MAQTTLSQSATDITASYSTRSYLRDGLLILSAALMVVTLYMVFMWVPTEQNLGVSQRIFYFLLPLAWVGMLFILVVAVARSLPLTTR